jgi:sec-independent protein translocase protein TatA
MQPPCFLAFGLPQGPEWIIILLVVLLLFGANKLPGLARAIGKSMGEFRRARQDFDNEIDRAAREEEEKAKKAASLPESPAKIDDSVEATPTDKHTV